MKFEDDFVGPDNRRLFLVWCGAVIFVISLGFFLNSDSFNIQGVAESREYQINFDRPVAIKKIHVLNGQSVQKGELLMELSQSELETQLDVLRARADRLAAELKLRKQIASVVQESGSLAAESDPLKTDWQNIQKEIRMVQERLRNLFVFAEVEGRVGAVNFKEGEKAPAFSPILTLLPPHPTYVNGFINESLISKIEVGQTVEVASVSGHQAIGKVVSLGTRIVPIPERLLRIQTLPAWGREVVVQIPSKNSLLVGERVSMRKPWVKSLFKVAQADESGSSDIGAASEPERIEFPEEILEAFEPEISGMVYIPELRNFVIISDDYPKGKPFLMLMNEQGQVHKEKVFVQGLEKMEDIESVSYHDPYLYLMSSQTFTKKGIAKKERHLFVRAARNDLSFQLSEQVSLKEVLLKTLARSANPDLKKLTSLSYEFEIEGHAIKNKDLFVSLKVPLEDTRTTFILKIKNFENLFKGVALEESDIEVAKKLVLPLLVGATQVLVTDLIFVNHQMYLASTYKGIKGSAIWRVDENSDMLNLVQEFKRDHLEALGLLPQTCQLFGVFEGKGGNYRSILSLPSVKKGAECF